jgi:hypothetical protein
VAAHTGAWLGGPRAAVKLLTERYGPPDALAPGTATWRRRGVWKRITVHGDASEGFLEQAVSYRAARADIAPLNAFGHGVRLNAADDELAAASGDESLNRLALNLANEIAVGRRGPEEAREFYAKTLRLSAAGKSSPYLTGILFEPFRAAREDPRRRGIGYY